MSPDDLTAIVRGEFAEMPGLRLTLPQACRLWNVDTAVSEPVLNQLVREGFLFRTAGGAFVMVPSVRHAVANVRTDVPLRRRGC